MTTNASPRYYVIPASAADGHHELADYLMRFLSAEDLEMPSLAGSSFNTAVLAVARRSLFFSYYLDDEEGTYGLWSHESAVGHGGKIYLEDMPGVLERLRVLFNKAEAGDLLYRTSDSDVHIIALSADSMRVPQASEEEQS